MSSLAVFDIEHGTASSVRSLDDHSVNRTKDGWSDIDTTRSHLNRMRRLCPIEIFGSGRLTGSGIACLRARQGVADELTFGDVAVP